MSAQHTPGPWEVKTYPDGLVSVEASAGLICRVGNLMQKDSGTVVPDARLIAAAPDMLEALREAEGEIYEVPARDKEQERVLGIVRAAIAKATGR